MKSTLSCGDGHSTSLKTIALQPIPQSTATLNLVLYSTLDDAANEDTADHPVSRGTGIWSSSAFADSPPALHL